MIEGNEENDIDEFAFDLLRRAKERSQLISSGKLKSENQSEQLIEKMMQQLEKKTSASVPSEKSPEKCKAPTSPSKTAARPILKPLVVKDTGDGFPSVVQDVILKKKSVVTCDAVTGDTFVEAKTYTEDDTEMETEDDTCGDNIEDLSEDGDLQQIPESPESSNEEEIISIRTPQQSKSLKKLTEFHTKEEVESPVHQHTSLETFSHESALQEEFGHVSASRQARSSRLSVLARTINEWETDTTHHSVPGSRFSESINTRASLAGRPRYSTAVSPSASSPLGVGGKQGHITGVRLFSNASENLARNKAYSAKSPSFGVGSNLNKTVYNLENDNICGGGDSKGINQGISDRLGLGFEHTVLTKLQSINDKRLEQQPSESVPTLSNKAECWDEALLKSLELQGFSRRQGSPLKQILKKSIPDDGCEEERNVLQQLSPKQTFFGGSPSKGMASVVTASTPTRSSIPSPVKSPMKSANSSFYLPPEYNSPVKPTSPPIKMNSPQKYSSPVRSVAENVMKRSPSPVKSLSPLKHTRAGSPFKHSGKSSSNESTPTTKPVSAIRMKFEGKGNVMNQGNSGPPKPERSRAKPYSTPGNKYVQPKSSPLKKFHFGETDKDPSTLSVAERAKMFEGSNFYLASKKPVIVDVQPKPAIFTSSPCVDSVKLQDIDVSSVIPMTPVEFETAKPKPAAVVSPALKSPVKKKAPPPPPPMPNTSTPTNAKRRSTSPLRSFPVENHAVKRIKVNQPKPGRMYPSLTDIDTETETEGHCSEVESMNDSIESEQSLGAEIETIAKAYSPIRQEYSDVGKTHARYRPSEDFSATFACAEVDALIDEALEGQLDGTTFDGSTIIYEADKTIHAAPEKLSDADVPDDDKSESSSLNQTPPDETSYSDADTTASSSFASSPVTLPNFSALSAVANAEKSLAQKPNFQASNRAITEEIEEESVPRTLMHTVSFYRKQQQQQKKANTCLTLHEIQEKHDMSDETVESANLEKSSISELIRKLENEVESHNLGIAQASKALNLCKALVGFSDSTEYIEGERILLIETQKRLALLNSIHRLKTEGALGRQLPPLFSPSKQEVTPSCKGNMKITDLSVTLRRDFFNARRAECQYHFICLLKNKHQIEHSTLLTYDSQKQGSILRFPNVFQFHSLGSDFQVILEIYFLESAKEFLPHEAKYRINAKKDSKQSTLLSPLLTPSKKSGKGEGGSKLLTRPQMHSPAGPDTIKSSSFKFCGSLSVDISSLQRTYWELDKVSGPLTGGVNLKLQCSAMGGVEHKAFLTLFEDVSGYGAWVRRWCRLGPTTLEFWKYPEDEAEGTKPPLGTLNLQECVTSRVRPAPREVCARANTLLLVTTRSPHPNDKDTLVTSCHKNYTAVRHLISADTREEREVWNQQLNKALANLRAWDPYAKQSVDDNLF